MADASVGLAVLPSLAELPNPFGSQRGAGLAAALHLIAAMKSECLAEFYYADLEESPIGEAGIPRNGRLPVPQGAGLGVEVDEAVVARYRVA